MTTPIDIEQMLSLAQAGNEDARRELHEMGLAPEQGSFRTVQSASEVQIRIGDEFITPSALSEDEFVALVRRIRDGELRELRFRARVFIDKPNANLFRPKPGQIPRIAAGAKGALYLVGHRLWSEEARLGDVIEGELGVDEEGNDALILDISITEPGAQEAFLRGRQDRFSIGWSSSAAECSECGEPVSFSWRSGWRFDDCPHHYGQELEDGRLVEVWYDEADLTEVSTVNRPAVSGTGILSQLCRSAEPQPGATPETQESSMSEDKNNEAAERLAAMEADKARMADEIAKLEQERAAADAVLFDALFDRAVAEGKALPREKDDQKAIFSALGRDKFQSMLANRPAIAGFSTETLGESSASPADQEPEEDVLALARHSRRIRRSNLTEAKLQEIGFNELRIVE